jgi:DNA-binding transcriptional MerR regulator
MLIREICRLSGLSKDTIRFYEKQGLIEVPRKDLRFNNYKEYSSEVLGKLLTIKRLKDFGFTLNEVAEYLELLDRNQASCGQVADKMNEKVKAIDHKIQELQQIKDLLVKGVQNCLSSPPPADDVNCPILTPDRLP